MKWIYAIVIVLISALAFGQRDLTPSNKRQAFGGARDTRTLNPYGLQIQLGGTFLMSKLKNETHEMDFTSSGFRGTYLHDPHGKLGGFVEIGMFHFPKKRSKLSLWMKTVLVSYYDWGVGFKYFRGATDVEVQQHDALGNAIGDPVRNEFNMNFGHVFARFSIHKNIHFKTRKQGDKSNFFLDNGLGINVDYRVLDNSDEFTHPDPIYTYATSHSPPERNYSSPLFAQIHYSLGLGFKLKRGSYLIPSVRLPLLGYQMIQNPEEMAAPSNTVSGQSEFGNPSIQWFSTKHWPILFSVKYMFAFEKKNKGDCPAVGTNDQDKETQRNR